MTVRLNDPARDGYAIVWEVTEVDAHKEVTVFATGEKGDVHNKASQLNTGKAGLFYPDGFTGTSSIEIRDADGKVLDSGTITV